MTEGEETRGRSLFDVSDLLFYLAHHATVSGIQRVVVETLPFLLAREPGAELVAFDPERRRFVLLDRAELQDLLATTLAVEHRASEKERVIKLAIEMREGLRLRRLCPTGSGDVLVVLGAGWTFPGFFKAVQVMKEDRVSVVVLVYDLIPLMMPGFPAATVLQFDEYIARIAHLADRVPCISASTRRDFEAHCAGNAWPVPPGAVTRLASGIRRIETTDGEALPPKAWSRPFVLFVSTVETRKNHLLVLRAWERLVAEYGSDAVPDLVCVGRLGWNVQAFLERYLETSGVGGRVVLLTDGVPDRELQALYRECLFTVYPSLYEGWGLPVGESLEWGKPAVVARNSSLEEVGGDFCVYFADNDLDDLLRALKTYLDDPAALAQAAGRIRDHYTSTSWQDVAEVLMDEIEQARRSAAEAATAPVIEAGVEYGLGNLIPFAGGHDAKDVLNFLEATRRLPLTGQMLDVDRHLAGELCVEGDLTEPDSWGRSLPRNGTARFRFARPADEPLTMLVSLREGQGRVSLRIQSPVGYVSRVVPLGGAAVVDLGDGERGTTVDVSLTAATAPEGDGGWGAIGLESFLVLPAADQKAQLLALQRVNQAVHAQLDSLRTSTSWRVTAPLRRTKEGAGLAARPRRLVFRILLKVKAWVVADPVRHDRVAGIAERVPALRRVADRATRETTVSELAARVALAGEPGEAETPTDSEAWNAVLVEDLDRERAAGGTDRS